MPTPPGFAFQTASTPDRLMEELEKLLGFWLGPWRAEYGEPESTLQEQQLPEPLRRLYAFAGRWPRQDPDDGRTTWVLNAGEGFRPLGQLERTRRGTLSFADECQQNWTCTTRTKGADPAVWVKDNCGMAFLRWQRVSRSLSRFLVTMSLRVLVGGSRLMLIDEGLARWFRALSDEAVPLWTEAAFPYYGKGISFYLLRDSVLVGDFAHDGIACAANHEGGIRLLTEHQSPINELLLARQDTNTSLKIRPDGSARFYVGRRPVDTPAGAFDFNTERDRLLAACRRRPGDPSPWYAVFHRSGQSGQRARGMTDPGLARELYFRAIAAVIPADPEVEELRQRFPLSP